MPNPFQASVREIDALIQQGDGSKAQTKIKALFEGKIERSHAAIAAGLAWRVGLPQLGIKLLNPLVRPSSRKPVTASDAEKVEYAGCLVKIGAPEEALALLGGLTAGELPRLLLVQAFAHISQWNYHAARPYLQQYVRHAKVRAYDRLVGKVNLAEAMIHDGVNDKARLALRDLLHDASLRRLQLVYGKTLELAAQFAIEHDRYDEADKYLKQAGTVLGATNGMDIFFVQKWSAFSAARKTKGSPEALAQVKAVRVKAEEMGHWETVRDCDKWVAMVTGDETLLRHLFHGTPYAAFRSDLAKVPGAPAEWGTDYVWQLSPGKVKTSLDLTDNSPILTGPLRPDQLLHRLFVALTSDFYRPFRVATLFSRLYSGEHYNPESSPHRVHEAVKRLRKFLTDEKLSIEVVETGGNYRLVAAKPFSIRVPLRSLIPTKKNSFLNVVKNRWPDSPFSVNEVSEAMKCSARTALTQVKTAVEEGALVKEGNGPATRYRLAS